MLDLDYDNNWETKHFLNEYSGWIRECIQDGDFKQKFDEFSYERECGEFSISSVGEWITELITASFWKRHRQEPYFEHIIFCGFIESLDVNEIGDFVWDAMCEYGSH